MTTLAEPQDAPRGRAVAYLRASTAAQDLGPDAQREAILQWGATKGIEVVAWHLDKGVSGGAPLDKRPALLAALDDIAVQGAEALVVARRDRLARDVLTAAMVERLCAKHGARVLSADGTANGQGPEAELLRGIVDVFAQYERAIIRSRIRAALAVKRARGERVGTIPYGFRLAPDGVHVEPHSGEQEAISLARRLRSEGQSLRAIGRALVQAGHRPRSANAWHVQVLKRMVA